MRRDNFDDDVMALKPEFLTADGKPLPYEQHERQTLFARRYAQHVKWRCGALPRLTHPFPWKHRPARWFVRFSSDIPFPMPWLNEPERPE